MVFSYYTVLKVIGNCSAWCCFLLASVWRWESSKIIQTMVFRCGKWSQIRMWIYHRVCNVRITEGSNRHISWPNRKCNLGIIHFKRMRIHLWRSSIWCSGSISNYKRKIKLSSLAQAWQFQRGRPHCANPLLFSQLLKSFPVFTCKYPRVASLISNQRRAATVPKGLASPFWSHELITGPRRILWIW